MDKTDSIPLDEILHYITAPKFISLIQDTHKFIGGFTHEAPVLSF